MGELKQYLTSISVSGSFPFLSFNQPNIAWLLVLIHAYIHYVRMHVDAQTYTHRRESVRTYARTYVHKAELKINKVQMKYT